MEKGSNKTRGSVIYFSHGGGPLPVLGEPSHEKLVAFLKELPSTLPKPDEILVISAHWEEALPTIIAQESPSLFYDYYGFPEEAYELHYPAHGHPHLAQEIHRLLEEHLLPLHVCFGIAGEKANVIFDDYILGKRAVAFRW